MNRFWEKINLLSIIFAILGVTGFSIITAVWNSLPFVKMYNAKDFLEKIKITQDYTYIVDVLGQPFTTDSIDIPTYNEGEMIEGKKAVFGTKYYTLISYFDDNNRLFGYYLISNNKYFKPKMFKNTSVMNKRISFCNKEGLFGGQLMAISSSYISRKDGSCHYMKYYSHHLSTNGCLIGVGTSSLGCFEDINQYNSLTNKENYFICKYGEGIVFEDYKSDFEKIDHCKINTFAVFVYDDIIDTNVFIRNECEWKMALTHIEADRLTD